MSVNKWENKSTKKRQPLPYTVQEKIDASLSLKNEGNSKFSSKEWNKAKVCYSKIFAYLNGIIEENEYSAYKSALGIEKPNDEQVKIIKEILVATHSNLSATFLKLNKFSEALNEANKALILDPDHTKAKYRKAQSLVERNEFEEAIKILSILKKSNPTDCEIERSLKIAKEKSKKFNKAEMKHFSKMFS
mmetsp:Transcript_17093/g.25285  ORF Transcript_17093/g.25285 Transcript_17093/m.25285 type:complete len:190 (-) Transcript_17093:25-594(-)